RNGASSAHVTSCCWISNAVAGDMILRAGRNPATPFGYSSCLRGDTPIATAGDGGLIATHAFSGAFGFAGSSGLSGFSGVLGGASGWASPIFSGFLSPPVIATIAIAAAAPAAASTPTTIGQRRFAGAAVTEEPTELPSVVGVGPGVGIGAIGVVG